MTAFGSADSHDEHYFDEPDLMIRGAVDDPTLTLNSREIARRHVTAFLLQRYHDARLPEIRPDAQPQLFAVLGTVSDFRNPDRTLNRSDLEEWLRSNESVLQSEVAEWLPTEIAPQDRQTLLENLVAGTLGPVDEAIDYTPSVAAGLSTSDDASTPATPLEVQVELGEESGQDGASENLLDRLLYEGVFPRYAFPTDVATFHVFDQNRSNSYRPTFRFTPSQGLSAALSQYAPGKEVWIDNKLWTSGAMYSPIADDRFRAWTRRRLYYECTFCHYSKTTSLDEGERGETKDCEACGSEGTLGPARYWMRPPGFAHPVTTAEGTSPDDQPARSYATRAKLRMPSPTDSPLWNKLSGQIRTCDLRGPLLVRNRGPREKGYTYCTRCGLIEPSVLPEGNVAGVHKKPYPDDKDQNCAGGQTSTGLMLGTDFISDVLIASISVSPPSHWLPETYRPISRFAPLPRLSRRLHAQRCNWNLASYKQSLDPRSRPPAGRGRKPRFTCMTRFRGVRDLRNVPANSESRYLRKRCKSSSPALKAAIDRAIAACEATRTSLSTTYWTGTSERRF